MRLSSPVSVVMLIFITLIVILLPSTSDAQQNPTTKTTTKAPVVSCRNQRQCTDKTQFCNTRQHICQAKRAVAASCDRSFQCISNKCVSHICRRSCNVDNDCSVTKEFCAHGKYCTMKHCGFCSRNSQCANNHCKIIRCSQDKCNAALEALKKLP